MFSDHFRRQTTISYVGVCVQDLGKKFMFDAYEVSGLSEQWRNGAGMVIYGIMRTQAYDTLTKTGVWNYTSDI